MADKCIGFFKNKKARLLVLFFIMLQMFNTTVFADDPAYKASDSSKKVINGIVNVALLVAIVVGILLIIVGVIKFVVAHANEDGPGQQKAAMLLATGIALLLLGGIFKALNLAEIVSNATSTVESISNLTQSDAGLMGGGK